MRYGLAGSEGGQEYPRSAQKTGLRRGERDYRDTLRGITLNKRKEENMAIKKQAAVQELEKAEGAVRVAQERLEVVTGRLPELEKELEELLVTNELKGLMLL